VNDKLSKLEALGEILEVTDDTRDLVRPDPPRSVGEILRGNTAANLAEPATVPADTPAPRTRAAASQMTSSPVTKRVAPDTAPQPRVVKPPSEQRSVTAPAGVATRSVRRQTSATLPAAIVDRLNAAKQHRWELSDLVVSALEHVELDPTGAEDVLAGFADDIRITRGYRVSADDLNRLDEHGAAWRMNRSQVITVILPAELHRLGL
jgi:hypothetical protein